MRKIAILLAIVLMTSCGIVKDAVYTAVTVPNEIEEAGGVIEQRFSALKYEVKIGEKITQAQTTTQTNFYLYQLDEAMYWKVVRYDGEVARTFFPKELNLIIYDYKSSAFYTMDETTGEKYFLLKVKWDEGYGFFYVLGNGDKQIVYSVAGSEINDW